MEANPTQTEYPQFYREPEVGAVRLQWRTHTHQMMLTDMCNQARVDEIEKYIAEDQHIGIDSKALVLWRLKKLH